jgi:hypothetical protein
VRRAENLTTFICRLSWNLIASSSWNPQGLSKPVQACSGNALPFTLSLSDVCGSVAYYQTFWFLFFFIFFQTRPDAWRSGARIPERPREFSSLYNVHIFNGVLQVSCLVDTLRSFPTSKAAVIWSCPRSLLPRLSIYGAVPPLFTTWCLFKHRDMCTFNIGVKMRFMTSLDFPFPQGYQLTLFI